MILGRLPIPAPVLGILLAGIRLGLLFQLDPVNPCKLKRWIGAEFALIWLAIWKPVGRCLKTLWPFGARVDKNKP